MHVYVCVMYSSRSNLEYLQIICMYVCMLTSVQVALLVHVDVLVYTNRRMHLSFCAFTNTNRRNYIRRKQKHIRRKQSKDMKKLKVYNPCSSSLTGAWHNNKQSMKAAMPTTLKVKSTTFFKSTQNECKSSNSHFQLWHLFPLEWYCITYCVAISLYLEINLDCIPDRMRMRMMRRLISNECNIMSLDWNK